MNNNPYSQEQKQALFNEYLESMRYCFNSYGGDQLMEHYIAKIEAILTAGEDVKAVITDWQANTIREIHLQLESGNGYRYGDGVIYSFAELNDYISTTYNAEFGLDAGVDYSQARNPSLLGLNGGFTRTTAVTTPTPPAWITRRDAFPLGDGSFGPQMPF